jgi:hypothetical protein
MNFPSSFRMNYRTLEKLSEGKLEKRLAFLDQLDDVLDTGYCNSPVMWAHLEKTRLSLSKHHNGHPTLVDKHVKSGLALQELANIYITSASVTCVAVPALIVWTDQTLVPTTHFKIPDDRGPVRFYGGPSYILYDLAENKRIAEANRQILNPQTYGL